MQYSPAYQLGILWPDGSTLWGDIGTYDDVTVQGYGRHETDALVHDWRANVRSARVDPDDLQPPRMVVRTVRQTFGDIEPVA